jgi:hypothetical protein
MAMKRIATFALALLATVGVVAASAQSSMDMGGKVRADTPVTGGGADATGAHVGETFEKVPTAVITTTALPPTIRKVSVLIESNPTNADIEVDGVYVGATPVQLSLKEGVHFVRISREGRIPWERSVKAYNGLTVSPTLVEESTIKRDVTVTSTTK